MKKILNAINNSLLGFIDGTFISDCSEKLFFENLKTDPRKESLFILEHNGILLEKLLFSRSFLDAETKLDNRAGNDGVILLYLKLKDSGEDANSRFVLCLKYHDSYMNRTVTGRFIALKSLTNRNVRDLFPEEEPTKVGIL